MMKRQALLPKEIRSFARFYRSFPVREIVRRPFFAKF
jgi:hypothetical protein